MSAYQLSVFLENRPGRLERVTAILADAEINLRAMTLTTSSAGWGVLNLLVDRPRQARDALAGDGFSAALREIVCARMPDRPGGLRDTLGHLARAGVNVENAYATILRDREWAILVIDVENVDRARALLADAGVEILATDQIYGI